MKLSLFQIFPSKDLVFIVPCVLYCIHWWSICLRFIWGHCCVFTLLHMSLLLCVMCILHSQVSVGLYQQLGVVLLPGRCAKNLKKEIMMWGCWLCWHGDCLNSHYFALDGFVMLSLKLWNIISEIKWKKRLAARFRMFQHFPIELKKPLDMRGNTRQTLFVTALMNSNKAFCS